MNKKVLKPFDPGMALVFLAYFLLAVFSSYIDDMLGKYAIIVKLAVLVTGIVYYIIMRMLSRHDVDEYVESFAEYALYNADRAAKGSAFAFPLPVVVTRIDGTMIWGNDYFLKEFQIDYDQKINIADVLNLPQPDFLYEDGTEEFELKSLTQNYKVYKSAIRRLKDKPTDALYAFCFINNTEKVKLIESYEREKSIIGLIEIDNYEELMLDAKDSERLQVPAMLDQKLSSWAERNDAVLQKLEKNRYMFLMGYSSLERMEKNRFPILDEVKEVVLSNKMFATLSIGIGKNSDNFRERYEFARNAIDVALGRGGDQLVVKSLDGFEFFGGKTKEVEKRTKVKSRVIATALKELIESAESVMVMGHKLADADALGSAIGVVRIAKNFKKSVHIVLDQRTVTVKRVIDMMKDVEDYEGIFIFSEDAAEITDENTLLVVVDTHRPNYTECPALIDICKNTVVIDHHRRGAEFIDKAALVFHEPYASSTCEMITEVLQYIGNGIKPLKEEAQALLAGIALDTKNFTFRAGVRTFEAASFLKRSGADTVEVKKVFQSDLDAYKLRAMLISESKILSGGMAICASENEDNRISKELAAQVADELLNINNVSASFMVLRYGDEVHISARSLGTINVHLIMEKLGGGGHQTIAGAQLKDVTLTRATELLADAITQYLEEQGS